jgi:hypothetical protein
MYCDKLVLESESLKESEETRRSHSGRGNISNLIPVVLQLMKAHSEYGRNCNELAHCVAPAKGRPDDQA